MKSERGGGGRFRIRRAILGGERKGGKKRETGERGNCSLFSSKQKVCQLDVRVQATSSHAFRCSICKNNDIITHVVYNGNQFGITSYQRESRLVGEVERHPHCPLEITPARVAYLPARQGEKHTLNICHFTGKR